MPDKMRQAVEMLRGGIAVVEEAIRQAGATPFERRRTLDIFQHAKGRIFAALDAIEKELKATQ
jgi:hypothetical protein